MEKDEAVADLFLDKKQLCLKANAQRSDKSIKAYIKQGLLEEYQYIVTHLLDCLKVR